MTGLIIIAVTGDGVDGVKDGHLVDKVAHLIRLEGALQEGDREALALLRALSFGEGVRDGGGRA